MPEMTGEAAVEVIWAGPFSWPGFESNGFSHPIPQTPGVYLQTFEYGGRYLIYAAGLTRRPIPTRFKEHTRRYLNGEYNVLDLAAVQGGARREIWHGWGYARKHRGEFEKQKPIILDAVHKQLTGFRIFTANLESTGEKTRLPERLEASIMACLYRQPSPICDIPDKGMQLAPRRPLEGSILVKNYCVAVLHGLPDTLEI